MFLGLGAILSALWVLAYFADAFRDLELNTVDTRFEIRGDEKPPDDLVVVQVDDKTFQDLDRRWPFPRRVQASAVEQIAADKPARDRLRRPVHGVHLGGGRVRAAPRYRRTPTARWCSPPPRPNERGESKILGGDAVLKEVGARPGNGVLLSDPGGVERRVPHTVDKLETLAVASAEVALGRQVSRDDFDARDETAWIDYYGPPGTIKSVPFSRAVQGKTPPGTFKDKVVVIGPSAPSLQDVHPTSTSGDELMAGAEIQASALDTILRGLPLQSAPRWLDVLLIVMFGMVAPVVSMRLSPLPAIAIALGVAAVFIVAAQLAFNGGTIVAFVYPLGSLVLATVGALAVSYVTTAFERERTRDLFARFVPENVVDEVLARTGEGLRIGGVQRDGTVMFTDLRGFTSFAESLPPDRVIEVLNHYLSGMSDSILDKGGTLVAYMGDGIMAVFGAPIEQPDHADRALTAAREMLYEKLTAFNDWIRSEGLGEGFKMGIGLNSGSVMSGNVGSERRLEYTAIGDTTNTASRIEGMTKGTPHQLFIADSTRSRLNDPPADLIDVGEFEVRGRQAKVRLWSLPDVAPELREDVAEPLEA